MAKNYWTYKGKRIPVKKYHPKTKQTSEQLYNQLIRKVSQANRRISKIKKEVGTLGWAGNILKNKTDMHLVGTWTSRGIRIRKNTTEKQMKATLRAIDEFLVSKTSTVKGIRHTIKLQQEGIRRAFSKPDAIISKEESKVLYSFFGDKDFDYITDKVNYKDVFIHMQNARDNNKDKDSFIAGIENYMSGGTDQDMRNALSRLYDKFIRE